MKTNDKQALQITKNLLNDSDIKADVSVVDYDDEHDINIILKLPQQCASSNELRKAIAKAYNMDYFIDVRIDTICMYSDDIRFDFNVSDKEVTQ